MDTRKKIKVVSFGFDNCLYHGDYKQNISQHNYVPQAVSLDQLSFNDELISSNRTLLDGLAAETTADKYAAAFVVNGSVNRQDAKQDKDQSDDFHTGYSFPALLAIEGYLNKKNENKKIWSADRYLLADAWEKTPPGTSFNKALANGHIGSITAKVIDSSGLSLLYAQIHKYSAQFHDDDIIFDYYNDSGLVSLYEFFNKNPDLLPRNVTLILHPYQNGAEQKISNNGDNEVLEVKGNADPEINFEEGYFHLLQCAGADVETARKGKAVVECNTLDAFNKNEDALKKFKNNRKLYGNHILLRASDVRQKPAASNDAGKSDVSDEEETAVDNKAVEKKKTEDDVLQATAVQHVRLKELITLINRARVKLAGIRNIPGANEFDDSLVNLFHKFNAEEQAILDARTNGEKYFRTKSANASIKFAEDFLTDFLTLEFKPQANTAVGNNNNDDEGAATNPLENQVDVLQKYSTQLEQSHRGRRGYNVLHTSLVSFGSLIIGAAAGFGIGLAIGAALGPAAPVIALIGAIVGMAVACGGVGALVTGFTIYKKQRERVATESATRDCIINAETMVRGLVPE